MNAKSLEGKLNDQEKLASQCFVIVVQNFLGNHKAENYQELINELLISYKALGYNMSLKIHTLDSHLDFFRPIWGLCVTNKVRGAIRTFF